MEAGGTKVIRVNYKETAWDEGLTVASLLQQMRADKAYKLIMRGNVTVIVNNEVIPPEQYEQKTLADGDEIRIYPFIAGG